MKISVQPDGWGHALPQDIEALLTDTASHISRLLRDLAVDRLHVIPAPESDWTPRTHYRHSQTLPYASSLRHATGAGHNLPISSPTNPAMLFRTTNSCGPTQTTGFMRRSVNWLLFLRFGKWQKPGQPNRRIRTGQIMWVRWQAMPTICYRIRNVNYHPVCL